MKSALSEVLDLRGLEPPAAGEIEIVGADPVRAGAVPVDSHD